MTRKTKIRALIGAGLFLVSISVAIAQLPTGTILGGVKDGTGAVVPGTSVTARNEETGQTRNTVTGEDGSYRFPALPVGPYELRAELPGFQTEVRSGLTLAVGQEAVVNFALQVGTVDQTVAVTAEAPLVNTTSGSIAGLVDEDKVAALPLNGRNYVDLAFLQPGIQAERRVGGGAVMAGQWFSSNGAPPRSNNFMLDGAVMQTSNDAAAASSANTTLGVEGIREFRVITNSFSAEYGLRMGSQMQLVSKNGTNDFHGSLFEYHRDSALDARNFFDRKTATNQRRLPAFTRNQFGGSLGGPIKRDKTFFFGVYEALRERLGVSQVFNTLPASAKIDDGHIVPQINPVIKPILALFPDPNLPNDQFTRPYSQPTNENFGQVRVDQNFSSNESLFARYTIDYAVRRLPPGLDGNPDNRPSRSQFGTLSETHIFSPIFLNTFRFSASRTFLDSRSTTTVGPQYDFMPGQGLGGVSISGYNGIGTSGIQTTGIQNVFTWSDDLYYTLNQHSLKFGVLINRYQPFVVTGTDGRGAVTFGSLANFLRGIPSTYRAITPGSLLSRALRYSTFGFYFQDDFRATPNLMLNMGIRYEFFTDIVEKNGKSSAFRDLVHDPAPTVGPYFAKNPSLKNVGPRFGFAWDVFGDSKTAVRGGFGLLYDVAAGLNTALRVAPPFNTQSSVSGNNLPPITLPLTFPPGSVGNQMRIADYNMKQPHLFSYNLTVERELPWNMGLTLGYAGSQARNLLMVMEGNPTTGQTLPDGRKFWTGTEPRPNPRWDGIELATARGSSWYNSLQVGLQKRLSQGLQFQNSFTWSKTLDQTQGVLASGETSNYPSDPLDLNFDKAPAGFDVAVNYRLNTIYRLPKLTSATGVMDKLLNGWGITGILSLQSGFPTTIKLTNNRSRSQNNLLSNGTQDRPDLVPGRTARSLTRGTTAGCTGVRAGQELGTPDLYFDPCAFTLQLAGFLGTAGRGILRGPGLATLDVSLSKDAPLGFLGDEGKLEFRAEAFNVLNRANFAIPAAVTLFSGSPTSVSENPLATAPRLTSTVTSARQIQLALKILF